MKNVRSAVKHMMMTLLIVGFAGSSAFAGPKDRKNFKQRHPRRAEVLGRANNEEAKNANAEASGKITKAQENKLNREDQRIKREEQRDARANGGHITKAEQAKMNREEDRVNQQRNNMEKRDAAAGGAAPAAPAAPATGQ